MRTVSILFLAGVLMASTGSPALAQETETGGDGTSFSLPQTPLQQARQRFDLPSTGQQTVPQEGAVDPNEYVVGPGDVFSISAGGGQPVALRQAVSAEGKLVIPGVGSVPADGRTLAAVKDSAYTLLRSHYENVNVTVTLSTPRQFYVHVVGAVPFPGRYLVRPVARVEEALSRAFVSDTTRRHGLDRERKPALRSVVITHQDGTVDSLDLMQYYATGDRSNNPYLRDGDIVQVGSYHPGRDAVFVDGNVDFPGSYPYRPGDTIHDLVRLATGGRTLPEDTRIRLTRQLGSESSRTSTYSLASVRDERDPISLERLDHVHVTIDSIPAGSATVEGSVEYPGTYPVRPGETTLRQLLDRAGGLRPDALAHGAYLVRERERLGPRARMRRERLAQTATSSLGLNAPIDTTLLRNVRMSDLDFYGQQYALREIQLGNRMPIDLSDFPASRDSLFLQDGDRVVVPRDQHSVVVLGHVNRSGRVAYRPTRTVEDYVRAAGGRAEGAEDVFVIKAGSKVWKPASSADVASGDIVFVHRENVPTMTEEVERLAMQRRDTRVRTTQAILSAVSTLTSLVTVYFAIRNR